MDVLTLLLAAVSVLLLVPVALLLLQVLVALPPQWPRPSPAGRRPRLAVLVPAHDEALGIAATVRGILAQLADGDRVVVVADNCSDDTAVLAREAGAEAIVRHDPSRRGKGYALDFGVRHLESAPPEVVVVVDADCRLGRDALDRLARSCGLAQRPVQALYLTHAPAGAGLKTRIAEFAWAVKNRLRPLGYARLGLPCQLMGTGMAFPWPTLRAADLASGHIVEDLKLGLDLTRAGRPPLFCPEAQVSSVFPSSAEGVKSQRTRWEHGHLGMIVGEGPRLLGRALARRDLRLAALVLDLFVPPLALLTLMVFASWAVGGVLFAVVGKALPFVLASLAGVLLGTAVLLGWLACGRDVVSFADLVRAPLYALSKIPLYLRFVGRRQVDWVRSRRDAS
ncbi:glycosyltransferase family 2 protein [Azoarcus sp. KH32C]|uniref:glycosyltransferase family 2 protein n=1 Tax=Azoarcus sp. KH32C TaxID=748247 RepID=UPI0002386B16|nr:glycosyltransferase family 2 protein [Azoarcus sp. KH32C]BAL23282.1 glycosyltransferase family protein [Azoarcus sp. KH32C]